MVSDPDYVDLVCFGINERDDIVGWHGYRGDTWVHGFLLRKGVFLNLDVPDALSTEAFGINARGDIVGLYIDQKQVQHGFLATAK